MKRTQKLLCMGLFSKKMNGHPLTGQQPTRPQKSKRTNPPTRPTKAANDFCGNDMPSVCAVCSLWSNVVYTGSPSAPCATARERPSPDRRARRRHVAERKSACRSRRRTPPERRHYVADPHALADVGGVPGAADLRRGSRARRDRASKTPMQTFLDAIPMTKEKMIAA